MAAGKDRTKGKPARKPRKKGEPLSDPMREAYAGQRAMGMSRGASYRKLRPNASPHSAETLASRLEAEEDVQERIREIGNDLLRSSDAYLTKANLAELLSDAIRRTLADELMISSASGLVDKYCKMFGFYEPEKVEARLGCLDEQDRDAKISLLMKLNLPQR